MSEWQKFKRNSKNLIILLIDFKEKFMKKSIFLPTLLLMLTACGEPTKPQETQAEPTQVSEPTPTADYSQINKTEVQAYVDKISDVIAKTKTINPSDTTAMHDWSKVIDNLKQEGLRYGENLFSEPYGRCAILGIDAQDYWQQVRGGDKLNLASDVLNRFNGNKKACEEVLQGLP